MLRSLLLFSGALVLVFASFGAAAHFGFINFDDPNVIIENEVIEGPGQGHLKAVFTEARDNAYLPLYYASFWIDHAIGGKSPRIVHAVNLVLHALVGVLLYFVLTVLLGHEGRKLNLAALLGAAFFLVHPVVIESVVWASGRKDLVSGLLFLAAFLTFMAGQRSGRALLSLGLAPALYLMALFAKASVLPGFLLIALALAAKLRDPRTRSRTFIDLIPMASVAFLALLVHLMVARAEGTVSSESGPFLARCIGMLGALGRYGLNALLPLRLSLVYDMPFDGSFGLLQGLGLVILGLALFSLRQLLRGEANWALGILWFLVALAPFNNIFPRFAGIMADRYLYLPIMGIALLLAELASTKVLRPLAILGAVIFILGLLTLSRFRTEVWSDSETLWNDAHDKAPNAILPLLQLGQVNESAATEAEAEKALRLLDDAARYFSEAEELAHSKRERAQALLKLASLETRRGRFELALAAYDRLDATLPDDPSESDLDALDHAKVTRATALAGLGRSEEAKELLGEIRVDSSAWAEARQNEAAIILVEATQALQEARSDGEQNRGIERYQEGLRIYQELLEMNPKSERVRVDYANALITARWLKDYEIEVTKVVNDLVRDFPKNAQARYHHARVFSEVDPLQALNDLKISVQLDPHREEPYLQLVRLLRATGNNKEAKLVIDKGLNSLPDSSRLKRALAETYISFGYHHRNTGSLELALESAARAVEILPEAVAGWQLLGEIREAMVETSRDPEKQRDDWNMAERAYQKVLELDPENTTARRGIALYHRVRGYSYLQIRLPKELSAEAKSEQRVEIRRQAMEEFLAAIEVAPGIEELEAVESQLRGYASEFRDQADDYLLDGKAPLAFPLAAKALRFGSFDADNLALMARTKLALGLQDEAMSYYDEALALDAKHLRSLYDYGRLLYERRIFERASAMMTRFLEAAPVVHTGAMGDLRFAAEQVVRKVAARENAEDKK